MDQQQQQQQQDWLLRNTTLARHQACLDHALQQNQQLLEATQTALQASRHMRTRPPTHPHPGREEALRKWAAPFPLYLHTLAPPRRPEHRGDDDDDGPPSSIAFQVQSLPLAQLNEVWLAVAVVDPETDHAELWGCVHVLRLLGEKAPFGPETELVLPRNLCVPFREALALAAGPALPYVFRDPTQLALQGPVDLDTARRVCQARIEAYGAAEPSLPRTPAEHDQDALSFQVLAEAARRRHGHVRLAPLLVLWAAAEARLARRRLVRSSFCALRQAGEAVTTMDFDAPGASRLLAFARCTPWVVSLADGRVTCASRVLVAALVVAEDAEARIRAVAHAPLSLVPRDERFEALVHEFQHRLSSALLLFDQDETERKRRLVVSASKFAPADPVPDIEELHKVAPACMREIAKVVFGADATVRVPYTTRRDFNHWALHARLPIEALEKGVAMRHRRAGDTRRANTREAEVRNIAKGLADEPDTLYVGCSSMQRNGLCPYFKGGSRCTPDFDKGEKSCGSCAACRARLACRSDQTARVPVAPHLVEWFKNPLDVVRILQQVKKDVRAHALPTFFTPRPAVPAAAAAAAPAPRPVSAPAARPAPPPPSFASRKRPPSPSRDSHHKGIALPPVQRGKLFTA